MKLNVPSTAPYPFRFVTQLLLAALMIALSSTIISAADPKQPDLVINDLKVQNEDGGTKLKVEFKIKNRGKSKAKPVEVLISGPGFNETRQTDKLDEGRSKGFEIKVPYPQQPGTVSVSADPNNGVAESDEGNNTATASLNGGGGSGGGDGGKLPDLVVEQVAIAQTKVSPPEVSVTIRVRNQGKSDSAAFELEAWQPQLPGAPQSFSQGNGLKAGQSQDFQFAAAPANLSPVTFIADADRKNAVSEGDEANNRNQGQLKIQGDLPDLVVDQVKFTFVEGRLAFSYGVRNAGGADFVGELEIKVDPVHPGLSGGGGSTGGAALRAGDSMPMGRMQWGLATVTVSEIVGTQIVVTVDPNNKVAESKEGNNTTIVIIPSPGPAAIVPDKPQAVQ